MSLGQVKALVGVATEKHYVLSKKPSKQYLRYLKPQKNACFI